MRALGQVAEPGAILEAVRWLAEETHGSARGTLQPEDEAKQRRLAASVRPRDRQELTGGDVEVNPPQRRGTVRIGEVDALELER